MGTLLHVQFETVYAEHNSKQMLQCCPLVVETFNFNKTLNFHCCQVCPQQQPHKR